MYVRDLIEFHEGRVPYAYQDSLGYWTCGVGFLIDKAKGGRIPDAVIDFWLDYEIGEKTQELERALPWLWNLDQVRRAVLIDMAFNLGVKGLLKWPIFLGQVKAENYAGAAANMRSTLWATQVKGRATRLAKMMETGEWPNDTGQGH